MTEKTIEQSADTFDTESAALSEQRLADCVSYITETIERLRDDWGDVDQFDAAMAYVALSVTSELQEKDMNEVSKVGVAVEKVNLQ